MDRKDTERIAIAIVSQACIDYRTSLVKVKRYQDIEKIIPRLMKTKAVRSLEQAEMVRRERLKEEQDKIQNIENFFRGQWFAKLCNIDPNYLMRGLQELAEGKRERPQFKRFYKYKNN